MTLSADESVVGGNGRVLVAPKGTGLPASISASPDPAFVNVGYLNDDGVKWTDGKTVVEIKAWQSFYAIRRIITEREGGFQFNLLQWNLNTVPLAFGGGAVTEDVPGTDFRYTPPAPGSIDERAMLVEWEDGTKNYRVVVPVGMVTENVESDMSKGAAGELPISFMFNGEDGADPWYLQTDDPAFDPTP